MIRFADPLYLWLLLLLPVVVWMALSLRGMSTGRKWAVIAVRTLMLAALILALSRVELKRDSTELSVLYLLDQSDSIPVDLVDDQLNLITDLSKQAGKKDSTGIIAFAAKPSLESAPTNPFTFEGRILSEIGGESTDISAALRLALAAFPADHMKRIVLLSDGNENSGAAQEVARMSRNTGVPIDVLPIRYESTTDARIEKIVLPSRTSKDAPFDVKIHLSAEKTTPARLRLFEDGKLIAEEDVTIEGGKNAPLVLSQRLQEGGFHRYSATIEATGDNRAQNNRAEAFTYLRAEPRVLLVDGSSDVTASTQYLAAALRAETILVDVGDPSLVPANLANLQRYDSVILSNVPAERLSQSQMQMLERGVHDLGIGLIMIGGEQSFGAGGYNDSPIELALPVDMDVKEKRMLPNGALVVILHTCEIPSGNSWAREISLVSLNVLAARDFFGLAFLGQNKGNVADTWAWDPPLQLAGDKRMMRNVIKTVEPLDMMSFDPTLDMASKELAKVKAETKHIVVISDGDPAPASQAVVNRIRDEGITVSAIAIAPHNGQTVTTLEQMAYWGGGNFYYPKTSSELPRIFTKEATVVRSSLIREEPFEPGFASNSEIIAGLVVTPALEGYVVTTAKELATVPLITPWEDPLLAHWRYGLGKSVAFTSDARDKWGTRWVQWGGFAKFWSQVIRWSLREANNSNFQAVTELRDGMGRVTVDATDEDGNFMNFLDLKGNVIGPNMEPAPITMTQVAPGRYEATFPATKVGTYMVSLQSKTGERVEALTTGASLAYSPEYETVRSADQFLQRIADASGGTVIADAATYNPYLRNLPTARRPEALWPHLLLLGILFLPLDVFLRRVQLDVKEFNAWIKERVLGIFPTRSVQADNDRLASLRAAKDRAITPREEPVSEADARAAFRSRLDNQASSGGSVFQDGNSPPPSGAPSASGGSTNPPTAADQQQAGLANLMEAKKRAAQRRKKD